MATLLAENLSTHTLPLQRILKAAVWLYYKFHYIPDSLTSHKTSNLRFASIIWGYADLEHGIYSPYATWEASIVTLLNDLREFTASKPLDHIFGIYGLLRKCEMVVDLPVPDYGRKLAEVQPDIARAMLEQEKNLDCLSVLYHRAPRTNQEMGIPSWVVRWDVAFDADIDPETSFRHHKGAGRRVRIRPGRHSMDPNELSVLGIRVDVVRKSLIVVRRGGEVAPEAMLDVIRRLSDAQSHLILNYSDRHAAIALSLTAKTDHLDRSFVSRTAQARFNAWTSFLRTRNELPPFLSDLRTSGTVRRDVRRATEYQQAFARACSNRAVFVTDGGHLGVGPKQLREDDVIAVLFGCKWPVVLRSLADVDEYEVVGTCYLHGIMEGEAVEAHSRSGKADDVFHLH